MTDREKEAFIGGIEFARDWNLDIPPDDLRLYERLIQERTKKAAGEQAENAGYTDTGDGFMSIPDGIDGDLPFM